jgi:hypothetical protein
MAIHRWLGAGAAGACLIVAAACVGMASRDGTVTAGGALLAQGGAAARKLRQLGGLISEVSAVKHALLAIEGREERGQPQQLAAGRPMLPGGLPAPAHTDSFDYSASVGGASQIQHGEWSRRSGNDDRLEMIPRRSKLRQIDNLVVQDECNWPECVTRSGLAPGTDLFPGEFARVTYNILEVSKRQHSHISSRANIRMTPVLCALFIFGVGQSRSTVFP